MNWLDRRTIPMWHSTGNHTTYIRHAKHHVLLTKTGSKTGCEHLGQPGRLQASLFETFFTRFDFAAHERWPIEMPDADTFHFLAVVHTQLADWIAYPEFAASCLPIFAASPTRYA